MEIGPTQVQSVQTLQRTEGARTEYTERRYEDIGGKIVVLDVHYYVYNRSGQVEDVHKPRVDLHV